MIDVLKLIAEKISLLRIKWIVFGSSGLALNGMQIEPDDIDILTDKEGLTKINQALGNYKIELPKLIPSANIDSTMDKFLIDGCSIEVMSNFKIKSRTDGKWYSVDHLLDQPKFIDVDNVKIPVLSLQQSIELYKLMGRDKDLIKISKIEEYLTRIK